MRREDEKERAAVLTTGPFLYLGTSGSGRVGGGPGQGGYWCEPPLKLWEGMVRVEAEGDVPRELWFCEEEWVMEG